MTELDSSNIPYGYCHCGCGRRTVVSPVNNAGRGYEKGKPRLWIQGHNLHRPGVPVGDQLYVIDSVTTCWIWQKTRDGKGYGVLRMNGRRIPAHRAYYEREYGPIPQGKQLDHLCRNRACVNPAHLEPVTHAENIQRGMQAKLTLEQVREIRKLAEEGVSRKETAARYNVTSTAVTHIVLRQTWKDV